MRRRPILVIVLGIVALLLTAVAAKAAADIRREQWLKSAHARRVLTVNATVEARGATAAHCGRCHSEQGYLAWLPQFLKGNPGFITRPDGSPADVPFLASLGLTKFSVRPQTCATCHNPDFSLRVRGSTPLLPAGFTARGVGAGAVCMTCHNTRNGAVQWNTRDPGRFTAPHRPSQADVIMGKNNFFVDFGESAVSPHAAFTGDACATCHVKLNPSSHTFRAQKTVCSNCHAGPQFKAERIQGPSEELLEQLEDAIGRRAMASKDKIATIGLWDPQTDQTVAGYAVDPSTFVSAAPTEFHGQMGLIFKTQSGRQLYTQYGEIKDKEGKVVFPTSDPLIRAQWNYFLFHGDGSKGVHNPRFYRVVLTATIEVIK